MKRRNFIKSYAAISTSPLLVSAARKQGIIDTNIYLGRNSFHTLPLQDPDDLAVALRNLGVTSAWAGPIESLFHRDLDLVNQQHAEICRTRGEHLFIPVGGINPGTPGWEESLRRCHEVHKMPAIRLHPGYHNYDLNHPEFTKLLIEARKRDLLVQIAPHMEDRRTQHPRVMVEPTNPTPLLKLLPKLKGLRIQIINGLRSINSPGLQKILCQNGVHFEISMLEGAAGIARSQIPANRLCYGSYAPVFIPESASFKVVESKPELDDEQLRSLLFGNAETLLSRNSR